MKKEKSCGAVVYRQGETGVEVLIIKHKNGGHWAFPKGHVEKKETEPETALREIKEETGLKVELDTGFREMVTYSPKPNVMKDVIYFAAKAKKDSAPPPARGGFRAPLGAAPRGAGLGHLRHRPGSPPGLFAVPGAIVNITHRERLPYAAAFSAAWRALPDLLAGRAILLPVLFPGPCP